jgi:hypothetical protein
MSATDRASLYQTVSVFLNQTAQNVPLRMVPVLVLDQARSLSCRTTLSFRSMILLLVAAAPYILRGVQVVPILE